MKEEKYAYPQNWINVGDINPERHGGIFVKWNRDMWEIIETIHFADLPNGVTENEYMFEHAWLEPMDIWKNGEPEKGFTEWAESELDSLSNPPFTYDIEEIERESSMSEFMIWVVENHIEWLVGNMAFSYISYYGGDRCNFDENYWGYLEDYGIDKDNF